MTETVGTARNCLAMAPEALRSSILRPYVTTISIFSQNGEDSQQQIVRRSTENGSPWTAPQRCTPRRLVTARRTSHMSPHNINIGHTIPDVLLMTVDGESDQLRIDALDELMSTALLLNVVVELRKHQLGLACSHVAPVDLWIRPTSSELWAAVIFLC